MAEVVNPCRAPTAVIADVGVDAEREAVRQAHVPVEGSLRSMGLLYCLVAAGLIVSGLVTLTGRFDVGTISLVLGLAMGVIGCGLRMLKTWVPVPAIALAAIGLLGFPAGTLINARVLCPLLCAGGRYVFTSEYEEIRKTTPRVRYRMSIIVRVLVGVLLPAIAAAVMIPMWARGF